jgi:hypothetical protein
VRVRTVPVENTASATAGFACVPLSVWSAELERAGTAAARKANWSWWYDRTATGLRQRSGPLGQPRPEHLAHSGESGEGDDDRRQGVVERGTEPRE